MPPRCRSRRRRVSQRRAAKARTDKRSLLTGSRGGGEIFGGEHACCTGRTKGELQFRVRLSERWGENPKPRQTAKTSPDCEGGFPTPLCSNPLKLGDLL